MRRILILGLPVLLVLIGACALSGAESGRGKRYIDGSSGQGSGVGYGAAGSGSGSATLLREDFESGSGTNGCIKSEVDSNSALSVRQVGNNGSAGLRISYEGMSKGSRPVIRECDLKGTSRSATLSFDVRFESNWQFVKGGKLLGLGPSNIVSGGGETESSGWSVRVMFHSDGVMLYIYDQNKTRKYGTKFIAPDFKFVLNRYYNLKLYVKVNSSADSDDAVARLYIDNVLSASAENLRLRGVGGNAALIEKFLLHTFHGGHDSSWAPKDNSGNFKTVHANFDNIVVTEGEPLGVVNTTSPNTSEEAGEEDSAAQSSNGETAVNNVMPQSSSKTTAVPLQTQTSSASASGAAAQTITSSGPAVSQASCTLFSRSPVNGGNGPCSDSCRQQLREAARSIGMTNIPSNLDENSVASDFYGRIRARGAAQGCDPLQGTVYR